MTAVSSYQNGDPMATTVDGRDCSDNGDQQTLNDVRRRRMEAVRSTRSKNEGHRRLVSYDWRAYSPRDSSWWHFFRWLIVGGSKYAEQTDEEISSNLGDLARCLSLLREYKERFGMPSEGGPKQQEMLLREILRDLYAGGAPLWALESVMQKVAEGLTGDSRVNWMILPRKAFLFAPSSLSTFMFKIERGFMIHKMEAMEPVAVRLASFASNTSGTGNVPSRFPKPNEFHRAFRNESVTSLSPETEDLSQEDLSRTILNLASESEGIFFFINSQGYLMSAGSKPEDLESKMDTFWIVSEEERELFSRLATLEAVASIEKLDKTQKNKILYPPPVIMTFRVVASAGAAGFWFQGSWQDMLVAGALALVVGAIGSSQVLSKQEKVVFETVASFVVGMISGLIALTWQAETCYQAMAIAGVLDILQGFRVVYAIIETMSKHTVAGVADLLEGVLFSGLIVSFLRAGQYGAARLLNEDTSSAAFTECTNGISPYWYFLFVPIAAISWSGLFAPNYTELLPMAFHGCFAFAVNYGLSLLEVSNNLNNFVSALTVTLSAGIYSRFSGRQAVGNTAAGLYVMVPGAYLVSSLYTAEVNNNFFTEITVRSMIIGIGAWAGTTLCSPTLLGATRGLMMQQSSRHQRGSWRGRGEHQAVQPTTMLFF